MATADDIETGADALTTEATPLVDVTAPGDDDPLGEIKECTIKEKAVGGAAAVAAAVSVAAMVVEGNPLVYLSGSAGLVVAPYAAFQQQKMTDTEALVETNERMEEEVDNLKAENVRLQASNEELAKSVDNLKDLEETLKTIKETETRSIDQLEEQVKEQREILHAMKGNLRSTILQNLITTVVNSDTDGDHHLDDDEIEAVIERISSIHGVDVKEEAFKAMVVGCGRSLEAVMEVANNLMDNNTPKEDRIFTIRERK